MGANGSGKTTLLNILCGDLESSDGTVSVPKHLRMGVLRQDQFVYEKEEILKVTLMGHPELWHAMVEKEALLAHAEEHFDADRFSELEETFQRHDGYTAEARAATILEGLGLPTEVHTSPVSTLSGGFKLRVLLAQVLAGDPDALLLDEPTAGINPTLINGLIDRLRRAATEMGVTLFVIEHNMPVIMNLADNIYCLANGRLLAHGTPEKIQNDERVINAYLGGHYLVEEED